ncbi:MAG: hypothetical protein H0V76_02075 [Blastocatellia bacterium]|nr:hypothetical protein [Blastocatellia bacterium]
MKTPTLRTLTAAIVLIVIASMAISAQSRKSTDQKPDGRASVEFNDRNSLLGSWYVSATPADAPPFRGLITFMEGGGMIASAQGDNLLNIGSLATAGHGAWVRTANREVLFTFRQIFYTADGSYDGGNLVRHTAVMDKSGMSWTGELTVEFFNSDDEVVFSSTGTVTATRIVPLPLMP